MCPATVLCVACFIAVASTEATIYCPPDACPRGQYCEPGFGFCMPCSYICRGLGAKKSVCYKHGCGKFWESESIDEDDSIEDNRITSKSSEEGNDHAPMRSKERGYQDQSGSYDDVDQSSSEEKPGVTKSSVSVPPYTSSKFQHRKDNQESSEDDDNDLELRPNVGNKVYMVFLPILLIIGIICVVGIAIFVIKRRLYQRPSFLRGNLCMQRGSESSCNSPIIQSKDEESSISCQSGHKIDFDNKPLMDKPSQSKHCTNCCCMEKDQGKTMSLPIMRPSDHLCHGCQKNVQHLPKSQNSP